MKMRHQAYVKVYVDKLDLNGKSCVIVPSDFFFLLRVGNQDIASCEYAKRLSDWAFHNGAFSVKHDYDLRMSDGEP